MNKTIIININSIVFHIEEEAYEILRSYMIDIKKHFGNSADSQEILQDIENRIAEMFSEKIQIGRKEVISLEDVNLVIDRMGKVSDFEGGEEEEISASEEKQQESSEVPPSAFVEKKLMRNPDDSVIGGVCSGLGAYFGMETKWMRLIFVCFVLFGGSGVMLYVILWMVMPEATTRADKMAMKGESPTLQNFKKSFDEELQGLNPHISKAKSEIAKGTSVVGSGISKLGRMFLRLVGYFILVICALTLLGLAIACVGFITGVLGYQREMVFPGTEFLNTAQAIVALIAGTLAIGIPFFALLQTMLRILFSTPPMNHYFSLGLWATWISSIIAVVFFSFVGAQEFKESSTIKVEKPLVAQKVYYITEKDVRTIEASSSDKEGKKFKIELDGVDLESALRNHISINFESIDSLAKPYVQYNYFARGKTYQIATTNAADINYLANQLDDKIVFNSHFGINPDRKYRDQSVSVTLYLPQGSRVIIDKSIQHKLRNLSYWDCKESYKSEEKIKSTEWIMGRTGLQCTPKFSPITKNSEEEDLDSQAEAQVREIEERANEHAKRLEEHAKRLEEHAQRVENQAKQMAERVNKAK
ncbi:PspC domain-containing protein [Sphingobacterium bovistauri]|uniref:PspC domain-containing protein n=1 Tax=Sphingobacterium bovistauri TaxID=2781959 RepID=A0ABS7Z585_9SPHI|nr:PspC domain-containing protein [Sphingobacterium bovistauri]MCA5005338.1 PspC domain-containing protein [Sphingobacterium bovistauri]